MGDWSPYLTSLTEGNTKAGGIFGKDGSTWINSPELQLSCAEVKEIWKCLDENCSVTPTGVKIKEDKYMNTTPPADKGSYVRLTGPINREDSKILIYGVATKTAVVVAFTDTNNDNRKGLIKNVDIVAQHLIKHDY